MLKVKANKKANTACSLQTAEARATSEVEVQVEQMPAVPAGKKKPRQLHDRKAFKNVKGQDAACGMCGTRSTPSTRFVKATKGQDFRIYNTMPVREVKQSRRQYFDCEVVGRDDVRRPGQVRCTRSLGGACTYELHCCNACGVRGTRHQAQVSASKKGAVQHSQSGAPTLRMSAGSSNASAHSPAGTTSPQAAQPSRIHDSPQSAGTSAPNTGKSLGTSSLAQATTPAPATPEPASPSLLFASIKMGTKRWPSLRTPATNKDTSAAQRDPRPDEQREGSEQLQSPAVRTSLRQQQKRKREADEQQAAELAAQAADPTRGPSEGSQPRPARSPKRMKPAQPDADTEMSDAASPSALAAVRGPQRPRARKPQTRGLKLLAAAAELKDQDMTALELLVQACMVREAADASADVWGLDLLVQAVPHDTFEEMDEEDAATGLLALHNA